ncbi:kinase-like domain-containing protein, partial [Polychytrium aggregatum]|uniref:kinase-like domain-containing protein n=1 Tax=Polychytrium aggregatum TaxID=110093 RepID=UPI0022FDC801
MWPRRIACTSGATAHALRPGIRSTDDRFVSRLQSWRVNRNDFDVLQTLATGAVGKVVCLVRSKLDKLVYAMKILKKTDLLTRREAAFFMEERNALVFAQQSKWMTTLYSAFQDDENLYLVMEYVSGGSVRNMLDSREEDMSEDETRFYMAEMMIALDELHKLSFIHRDVKPENYLIDATGHIKLADFGSCMRMNESRMVNSTETVGTPDYISPEILRAQEGNVSYGRECDWWSLGIIMYEFLFGDVPFYSESLSKTYSRIMNHEVSSVSCFHMPPVDILICKREVRLGREGSHDIRAHPWFQSVQFDGIRNSKPPFVPELSGPDDTRYFENEEDE